MWNWLKNFFGGKKQEREKETNIAGEPEPTVSREKGEEEKDASKNKN